MFLLLLRLVYRTRASTKDKKNKTKLWVGIYNTTCTKGSNILRLWQCVGKWSNLFSMERNGLINLFCIIYENQKTIIIELQQ